MAETYEFGSPGWFKMAGDIAEQEIRASGIDLSEIDYTFGEEFTNVPKRLHPSGGGRIGYCVRIVNGQIETAAQPPPPEADCHTISDWEAVEPLAHAIYGEDPVADAEFLKLIEELKAQGKMRREEKRERPPELKTALADLHNAMCRYTAPRLD
jgi:hypothetical protein